jgi:hypothetical protein
MGVSPRGAYTPFLSSVRYDLSEKSPRRIVSFDSHDGIPQVENSTRKITTHPLKVWGLFPSMRRRGTDVDIFVAVLILLGLMAIAVWSVVFMP